MPDPDRIRTIETTASCREMNAARCTGCGAAFHCGAGETSCWCAAYPHVMPVPRGAAGCYCPACLAELTGGAENP